MATPQQVLDLPIMDESDSGATTIRGYLLALLEQLWAEGEGFSSKRPFGNSNWEFELYAPLIKAGFIDGSFDEDGYVSVMVDSSTADALILSAIKALGEPR